jgi:hypothetical protein
MNTLAAQTAIREIQLFVCAAMDAASTGEELHAALNVFQAVCTVQKVLSDCGGHEDGGDLCSECGNWDCSCS